jgi:hypothetical protein
VTPISAALGTICGGTPFETIGEGSAKADMLSPQAAAESKACRAIGSLLIFSGC